MKQYFSPVRYAACLLAVILSLHSTPARAQAADTSSQCIAPYPALQFQLFGGLGVYYLGSLGSASQYRIGADVSYSHDEQDYSTDSRAYVTTVERPYWSTRTGSQPSGVSNSYQASVSGLYIQQLIEYQFTQLYCGVGPQLMYSWSRNTYINKSRWTDFDADTIYNFTSYEDVGARTTKISAIGPLALFGVRSRVVGHVSLSAEIGVTASYQWTRRSSSYTSIQDASYSSSPYTIVENTTDREKGWHIALNAIRIGLVVGL